MVSHHQGSRRGGSYVWYDEGSFLFNTITSAGREAAVQQGMMMKSLRAAGLVSYRYETAMGLATKILHVYDIELPEYWRPFNGNGEIDGFTLMRIPDVIQHMRTKPDKWKPNAMLVNIDLAVRRGYITPDDPEYLELVHSLRVTEEHKDFWSTNGYGLMGDSGDDAWSV